MKVLFATDGSAHADAALEIVISRPWPKDTVVRVVTVVESIPDTVGVLLGGVGDLAVKAETALKEDLMKVLAETSEKLKKKFGDQNVSQEMMEGSPKEKLIESGRAFDADMIVLGSHGITGSSDSWFGSVARNVIMHAPCAVQILHSLSSASLEKRAPEQISLEEARFLIAISDTDTAQMVLNSVLNRPWPEKSRFRVLSVVPLAKTASFSRFFRATALKELNEKTQDIRKENADKLVTQAGEQLAAKFGKDQVTYDVLVGNPRSLILEIAQEWPADLIILGSHDKEQSFAAQFLGSVAAAVVWNATCSVELVKNKS